MNLALLAIALLQTVVHMPESPPASGQQSSVEQKAHPEASPYLPDRNARADIERALADAKISGKKMLIVMGANWCHDSRALAGWFATSRFSAMLSERYEIVYVDVGTPQIGKGRNLEIAGRFGIKTVKSTPIVFILSSEGKLLNSRKEAIAWRNAASRSENRIFAYFDNFTPA